MQRRHARNIKFIAQRVEFHRVKFLLRDLGVLHSKVAHHEFMHHRRVFARCGIFA